RVENGKLRYVHTLTHLLQANFRGGQGGQGGQGNQGNQGGGQGNQGSQGNQGGSQELRCLAGSGASTTARLLEPFTASTVGSAESSNACHGPRQSRVPTGASAKGSRRSCSKRQSSRSNLRATRGGPCGSGAPRG